MAFRNGKTSCSLCSTGTPPASTHPFPLVFEADVPSGVVVGDLVYITGNPVLGVFQADKVDVTDQTKMPAVGVVTVKTTATRATIQSLGDITTSGLNSGSLYFIGLNGQVSSSPPPPSQAGLAITQEVGTALSTTQLRLRLSSMRFKRGPNA